MKRWEQLRRLNMSAGYHPEDLAGIAELAEEVFHVSPSTVTSWNSRRFLGENFPPPVRKFKSGPIFSVSEYLIAWNDWVPRRGQKAGILLIEHETLLYWIKERIAGNEHGEHHE